MRAGKPIVVTGGRESASGVNAHAQWIGEYALLRYGSRCRDMLTRL